MDELLQTLNIKSTGIYDNDVYVVDLIDDKTYAKVCTTIFYNDDFDVIDDKFNSDLDGQEISYSYKNEFEVTLKCDFNDDIYALKIKRTK